jgi:hypothetical protein
MVTPQVRSLNYLRKAGFAESVEKYAPFPDFKAQPCKCCGARRQVPRRVDLFNAFDIFAITDKPELVQVTTGSNAAQREAKLMCDPEIAPIVERAIKLGIRVSVHSWFKNSKGRWDLTVREITQEAMEF